jgi:hypothetical protein
MKLRAQLEDSGVGGRMVVKSMFKKSVGVGVGRCEKFIWLNTGIFSGFVQVRKYIFERHNRHASREGLWAIYQVN